MQAAFCSWYSSGGEIAGLLTQLPLSDLNATGTFTAGQTGELFGPSAPRIVLIALCIRCYVRKGRALGFVVASR